MPVTGTEFVDWAAFEAAVIQTRSTREATLPGVVDSLTVFTMHVAGRGAIRYGTGWPVDLVRVHWHDASGEYHGTAAPDVVKARVGCAAILMV